MKAVYVIKSLVRSVEISKEGVDLEVIMRLTKNNEVVSLLTKVLLVLNLRCK